MGASPGHYVDISLGAGQSTQTACNPGTYNPIPGSTTPTDCLDVSPGYYATQPGQSSQTACPAGTYNPNTGSTAFVNCIGASPGYYVDSLLGKLNPLKLLV